MRLTLTRLLEFIVMSRIERVFLVAMYAGISVASIAWIGQELHGLVAIFNLLVGVLMGMALFLPNSND